MNNLTYMATAEGDIRIVIPGKGELRANINKDPDYPGIDVEFVSITDNGQTLSRPRVLIEYPQDGNFRALAWTKTSKEDYTEEISFEEVV